MELAKLMNYLRFFAILGAFLCTTCPWKSAAAAALATLFYSAISPLLTQSSLSIFMHKCISHVPSTMLLVMCCLYDQELRPYLLAAGGIEYLSMWLLMYSEIFTKTLRNDIIARRPLQLGEEISWVLNDAFLLVTLLLSQGAIVKSGFVDKAYLFLLSGFIARKGLNVVLLFSSITDIVALEPKKD